MNRATLDRTEQIVSAYHGGMTLLEIGVSLGITGERVRQILKASGVTFANSEKHLSKIARQQAAILSKREARAQKQYGCDWLTFKRIANTDRFRLDCPLVKAYRTHQKAASASRIQWQMTLPQYAEIVGPHLNEIGRGKMTLCRQNKRGAFSSDNVSIKSQSENSRMTNGFDKGRDWQKERSEKRQAEAMALAAKGLSRREISERMHLSKAAIQKYFYRDSNE